MEKQEKKTLGGDDQQKSCWLIVIRIVIAMVAVTTFALLVIFSALFFHFILSLLLENPLDRMPRPNSDPLDRIQDASDPNNPIDYFLYSQKVPFMEAVEICRQKHDGTLLSHSKNYTLVNNFIRKHHMKIGDKIWMAAVMYLDLPHEHYAVAQPNPYVLQWPYKDSAQATLVTQHRNQFCSGTFSPYPAHELRLQLLSDSPQIPRLNRRPWIHLIKNVRKGGCFELINAFTAPHNVSDDAQLTFSFICQKSASVEALPPVNFTEHADYALPDTAPYLSLLDRSLIQDRKISGYKLL